MQAGQASEIVRYEQLLCTSNPGRSRTWWRPFVGFYRPISLISRGPCPSNLPKAGGVETSLSHCHYNFLAFIVLGPNVAHLLQVLTNEWSRDCLVSRPRY